MKTCRACGEEYEGARDVCPTCLSRTPACIICGRAIDDHSLTYSEEQYPRPICPEKGEPPRKKEG